MLAQCAVKASRQVLLYFEFSKHSSVLAVAGHFPSSSRKAKGTSHQRERLLKFLQSSIEK